MGNIKLNILRACLFLSGAVALVLQMALEKYLSTLVGSAAHSVVMVLVLFFVGIALGAWLAPVRSNAWRRLIGLEVFIGFWVVLVALGFYDLYAPLSSLWLQYADMHWLRVIVAAFWLLPPTIAMGMHFPICTQLLAQHDMGEPRYARSAYAFNILGAGVAALAVPYTFFYWFGIQWTLLFVGTLCVLITWMVYAFLQPASSVNEAIAQDKKISIPFRYLYIAFMSGCMFFALEILWFHLIGTMLGSYVYTFSILSAAVLLSLALAGFWVNRKRADGASVERHIA